MQIMKFLTRMILTSGLLAGNVAAQSPFSSMTLSSPSGVLAIHQTSGAVTFCPATSSQNSPSGVCGKITTVSVNPMPVVLAPGTAQIIFFLYPNGTSIQCDIQVNNGISSAKCVTTPNALAAK